MKSKMQNNFWKTLSVILIVVLVVGAVIVFWKNPALSPKTPNYPYYTKAEVDAKLSGINVGVLENLGRNCKGEPMIDISDTGYGFWGGSHTSVNDFCSTEYPAKERISIGVYQFDKSSHGTYYTMFEPWRVSSWLSFYNGTRGLAEMLYYNYRDDLNETDFEIDFFAICCDLQATGVKSTISSAKEIKDLINENHQQAPEFIKMR